MSSTLHAAIAVVRAWTRLYTWRMPAGIRETRRAEIESDLWEFCHHPDPENDRSSALHVLARLLLGIQDDLSWRVEHAAASEHARRRALALGATAAFVMVVVWLVVTLRPAALPPLPAAPMVLIKAPPPPPPPPPPCRPQTLTGGC